MHTDSKHDDDRTCNNTRRTYKTYTGKLATFQPRPSPQRLLPQDPVIPNSSLPISSHPCSQSVQLLPLLHHLSFRNFYTNYLHLLFPFLLFPYLSVKRWPQTNIPNLLNVLIALEIGFLYLPVISNFLKNNGHIQFSPYLISKACDTIINIPLLEMLFLVYQIFSGYSNICIQILI